MARRGSGSADGAEVGGRLGRPTGLWWEAGEATVDNCCVSSDIVTTVSKREVKARG